MKLKINRWEFDVTNKDLVLDNGSIIQCITLKHETSWYDNLCAGRITVMSKKQFKQLLKDGLLIELKEEQKPVKYRGIQYCRVYRFNVK